LTVPGNVGSIAAGKVKDAPAMSKAMGQFEINRVTQGDCLQLVPRLPDRSIDVVVTSPPYWGQRISNGTGVEEDPREYLRFLVDVFSRLLPKLKEEGIVWINLGDAYNTPVNWRNEDCEYSSLGPDRNGLPASNSAYTKPRAKRKPFINTSAPWLQYGNLLALPYRLVLVLCEAGYLFRGEVIWRKRNPMPEGRCRRPHRQHESVYLLTKSEKHAFKVTPPVGTIWDFPNEKVDGVSHHSRFPEELPRRCIEAYGKQGEEVVVLDPFAGSGTTGVAARKFGCSFLGFEIEPSYVEMANAWIGRAEREFSLFLTSSESVATR